MDIILASQSPSRKALLDQIGIQFECVPSGVDESSVENSKGSPDEICLKLAIMKAEAVQKLHHGKVIIASDQLAFLGLKPYGKAYTISQAQKNLESLQGKTHHLINGLCMIYGEKNYTHISTNNMTMRTLSPSQIANYIKRDQPIESSGSYKIEKTGIGLFEKIESDDFSSILGLPLTVVVNQLIQWGYKFLN